MGDLLWSILGSVHAIGGSTLKAQSFSELYVEVMAEKKTRIANEDVRKSVMMSLKRFSKGS